MKFRVGCELNYKVTSQTTMFLNIEAQGSDHQFVEAQSFNVTPAVSVETHQFMESANLYRRVLLEPGSYKIRYDADVTLSPQMHEPSTVAEVAVAQLPFATLPFLYPSRFCQSDHLRHFAWREFGSGTRGYERVTTICNWIYENVEYLAGSSEGETSAYETFSRRAGVCRDFAHLGITFCRALGIPARFVSAYAWQLEPADFHAVFEAYLSGRWYLFDATRLCPVDGIVRIGVGRDAADTAFATFYGMLEDAPKLVWAEPRDTAQTSGTDWTTLAVSTAAA